MTLDSALSSRMLSATTAVITQHNFTANRSVVMVPRELPVGVLPKPVESNAPSFNIHHCVENGSVLFQLSGVEPDGQLLIAKIVEFPQHGVLYDIASDGATTFPIAQGTTKRSEVVISQWVAEVVGFSSEWASAQDYLKSVNLTMTDVNSGNASQVSLPRDACVVCIAMVFEKCS